MRHDRAPWEWRAAGRGDGGPGHDHGLKDSWSIPPSRKDPWRTAGGVGGETGSDSAYGRGLEEGLKRADRANRDLET